MKVQLTMYGAEAEFIFSLLNDEVGRLNDQIQKSMMLEHRDVDNVERYRKEIIWYKKHIQYIEELKQDLIDNLQVTTEEQK